MQSQIARLNQDLSFYRGLVQPDSLVHVKVQQMQIVPEPTPGQYRLKFVLMQTGKPTKEVAGSAAITIDGLLHGKPSSLNFVRRTHTVAARIRAHARGRGNSQRPGSRRRSQFSAGVRLEGTGNVGRNRGGRQSRLQG